jgi:hypothetical protein
MSGEELFLDAAEIRNLLVELGARLDRRGVEGRIFLVGGAAMALAFSRDRITRHLDGVFEPEMTIYEEAAIIARDRRLPDGWLNDSVKALLPGDAPPVEGTATFSTPGLHVGVASADYLFAMKAMAARQETDGTDLRILANELGLSDVTTALDHVERYYGSGRLGPKTQLIIEDLFADPPG